MTGKKHVYFPALDGLRAVAFLMVFAQHYGTIDWGWTGVDIFFVLSGFLITGILYRAMDTRHRFRTFYTRRALRIFPLYYGLFLLLLLLTPVLRTQWNALWWFWIFHVGNYLRNWPAAAFGQNFRVVFGVLQTQSSRMPVMNLGHLWSLCVEEQFYLLWPLVVFTVRSRKALITLGLVTFAAMPFVRFWMERTLPVDALHGLMGWGMPFRADSLLLGGALALWTLYPSGEKAVQAPGNLSIPFIAVLVAFAAAVAMHVQMIQPPIGHLLTYTFVDAGAAIVVFEAIRPASLLYRLLQWKPLKRLGLLSYGAYIFHDIPHTLYQSIAQRLTMHHAGHPLLATAMVALPATYAMAYISFRYYESRFLRLKQRFAPEEAPERSPFETKFPALQPEPSKDLGWNALPQGLQAAAREQARR